MTLVGLLAGLIVIAAGVVALLWGSKLYKFLLPFLTGLAGVFLGLAVGAELDSTFYALVLAAVLGIAGAVLAFFLWKAGVVINFVTFGYLAGTLLVRGLGLESQWFAVLVGVTLGLAAGYFVIAFRAWEWLLAIGMSLNGAFLISAGVISILYGAEVAFRHRTEWTGDYNVPTWMDILFFVLAAGLALYGFRFQVMTNPDIQEWKFERSLMKAEKQMASPSSKKSSKKKSKK